MKMTKEDYAKYLKSPHWKAKRKEAIQAHGCKCSRCGRQMGSYYMRVHHKSYANLGNEPLDDLEVMCVFCHEVHHGVRDHRSLLLK